MISRWRGRSHAERVDIVLRSAWGGDPAAAARILARWPEIATHDLYIAVATGHLAEVRTAPRCRSGRRYAEGWAARLGALALCCLRALARRREARARSGEHPAGSRRQPERAVRRWLGQSVQGSHRRDRPGRRRQAAPSAGTRAGPAADRARRRSYDSQALYNTSITRDDTTWLDLLWTQSERRDRSGEVAGGARDFDSAATFR